VERSVLLGLAAFRWAAWVWMAIVLALARGNLVRPGVAVGLVLAALLVTAWSTAELTRDPRRALAPRLVGVELVVALGLQVADGFVYRAPHVFTTQQPLGVAWPIAAVMSAGVAFGPLVGVIAGVGTGLARTYSSVLATAEGVTGSPAMILGLDAEQTLSVVTSVVLYAFAGGTAGYAMQLIRAAEGRITAAERDLAESRAREQVAREREQVAVAREQVARSREQVAREREDLARRLHDGVLQTLALVERRVEDPALAKLARDQERELRHHLFAVGDERVVGRGELGDVLRQAGDLFELTYDVRVSVLVPDDVPVLAAPTVAALSGAVGEALTNVGKHARAGRVVIAVEPLVDDGVVVSVLDDGGGFDVATTPERVGRARSIRGRVEEVGGTASWVTRPGHGCEVRLRVPPSAASTDRADPITPGGSSGDLAAGPAEVELGATVRRVTGTSPPEGRA
jgi:signal transduction histidine kinase